MATSAAARADAVHPRAHPPQPALAGRPLRAVLGWARCPPRPAAPAPGCSWLFKLDPGRFTVGNLHQTAFSALTAGLGEQNLSFAGHDGCPLPVLSISPAQS